MDTGSVTLYVLLGGCAVALALWICMMIYRGALEAHEEDQIFVEKAEESRARDQRELIARIERLTPIIRGLLIAWIVLAVAGAGLWIWQGLRNF